MVFGRPAKKQPTLHYRNRGQIIEIERIKSKAVRAKNATGTNSPFFALPL